MEDNIEITPGTHFPEPLPDYSFGLRASWELDVWKRLRNARKAAALRYLATQEGRNFMVTQLVSEIAESYYELLALDNMMDIINRNIEIQSQALQVVRQQKDAARVTQLAVNRFEAQLLNTKNLQYEVKQRIVETENRINFLTGRYAGPVKRNSSAFFALTNDSIPSGIPSQLLQNRADIRQAELELAASKLDVQSARALFFPQVGITAGLGYQAFNPSYLLRPESVVYNLFGDLVAPLVNRNAIVAQLRSANARQIQAAYRYEQTVLNAYTDVLNQLARLDNFSNSYALKSEEVDILSRSVNIANNLFTFARADYAEVLLTQREALEARRDLIEVKLNQLQARVGLYRALGGGWR
ncbi:MAG: TolC family protein [Cyclobacteriaceae bacterium]|nr:TolC family protein [Cyclobacteriaceae bacterium]